MAHNHPYGVPQRGFGPTEGRFSEDFGRENPDGTPPYSPSMEESSLSLIRADRGADADEQEFIINKKELQLAAETAWFKDFLNRTPNAPFRKSFRAGSPLDKIAEDAPLIRIGVTFMGGADKPTVVDAELQRLQNIGTLDRTPEWKVYTGGSLLKRMDIGGNMEYRLRDDSAVIINAYQARTAGTAARSEWSHSRAVSRITDHDLTLTIDSARVDLLHALPPDPYRYDLVCTLIEVDMFSMQSLMENHRRIVRDGGRTLSTQQCLQILDTMINDVRRLCTRSPRLFRMSTRALIAQSADIRYGVDFDSQWIPISTSQGIRHLIHESAKYYLSLNDNPEDKETVRPKFLQMIVLLMSLINNKDLRSIKTTLELSFHLPGDRVDVELLIMKVLPLGAANPTVFLRGLEDAYNPRTKADSYEQHLLGGIWRRFHLSLARNGYLVPHATSPTGRQVQEFQTRLNLQNLNFDDGSDSDAGEPAPMPELTWMLGWGSDGVESSAVLKDLQHDTVLRLEEGDRNKNSIRSVNIVPHFDITADEKDQSLQVDALFTNHVTYRLHATLPDEISTMRKGDYTLVRATDGMVCTLEIRDETVNDNYISATKQVNYLIMKARTLLPEQRQSRVPFGRERPSAAGVPKLSVPSTAQKVWATIVPSDSGNNPDRVATAFKIDNKMVFQYDVLGEMTRIRGKLNATVARIEGELAKFKGPRGKTEAERRAIQQEFNDFGNILHDVKLELAEGERKRAVLSHPQHNQAVDPILKVVYPSFSQSVESRPSWAAYQTELLAADNKSLVAICARLTVTTVDPSPAATSVDLSPAEQTWRLSLKNCGFVLHVKPLSQGRREGPEIPKKDDTLLWMGFYLVLVRPVPEPSEGPKGFEVIAFYRVQSQEATPNTGAMYTNVESLRRRPVRLV